MAEWTRELDQLREDSRRDIDRLARAVERCVTESFYLQAQKQNGERIEAAVARVTAIENDRKEQAARRQREHRAFTGIWIAAALAFLGELCILILQLVSR